MFDQGSSQFQYGERYLWTHNGTMRLIHYHRYEPCELFRTIVQHWWKILVNSLFCKLFKHSFCLVVRQGSHLRLCCELTQHTDSKTQLRRAYCLTRGSRRPCVEIFPLTLRILSLQKLRAGGASFARAATTKVGGAAHACCTLPGYHDDSEGANGDESTGVCVQLPTRLPLVMQLIFTVFSGCR